jgi:tRNA uridine 5-carbamoylmethylation protein Kti12
MDIKKYIMENEKTYIGDLILLRGVPGSGKTTLGSVILRCLPTDNPDVISADDYFTDEKGNYNFDGSKLKEAHNDCQQRCAEKMRNQFSRIVVANTFTQEWEMELYYEMAERYKYRVHSVIVENRHDNSNVHDVPLDKVEQMKKRFQIKL